MTEGEGEPRPVIADGYGPVLPFARFTGFRTRLP
jgi:hypothetical protein